MSSVESAARALKALKDEEWRTLAGLERTSAGYGTADIGRLSRSSRLPKERVSFAVSDLEKRGLLSRRGAGFALTREGVEAMALKDYVRKDLIFALGAIIAKGKESDVYEVLTEEGVPLALKFYKIGRTSFTRARRRRAAETSDIRSWMTTNYAAASREYRSLRKLDGLSGVFPRAISYSRSTVLLEQVSGVRLSQRPYLEDPAGVEAAIFGAMRKALEVAGLVNADLSEYNILTNGSAIWIIDWPQAVDSAHPNSEELLKHDVTAVATFFGRAYGVAVDAERALGFVRGEAQTLE
ncbi:MAG TPA: RIO1 family regulatory kinase/ATPase [Nitrososphaerales archaeon]|nr:RIO1 family regulatory kinase/ATPase [Nitrososphaerales archaeon]